MEVRIGIQNSPRELSFETTKTAAELRAAVTSAYAAGEAVISFTDKKENEYLVPLAAISFVELGAENVRKAGFVN